MAASGSKAQRLYYFSKPTRWSSGIGALLPEEYSKFWKEWKLQTPTPVHYIPREGKYELDVHGVVKPIQNRPLPLLFPKELHEGIWGGEAVVRGFIKNPRKRRFIRYWTPQLRISVVYSEILNKYMRMTVTERTLDLIHENYGFDHYILKSPACDLQSHLALELKRKMLISLADKTLYPDDTAKRDEVYAKYEHYLKNFTRKEIEWYGLTWAQACRKFTDQARADYNPVPLKVRYRQELIKILEAEQEGKQIEGRSKSSWLSKINPFSKNQELSSQK